MDSVRLDRIGDINEVLVNHGNQGYAVFGGKIAEDLIEGVDVVGAVVWRQGDACEQYLDMRNFECVQNRIKVAACLIEGQAAETVVAAEFDDDDGRVKGKYLGQALDGVFGGGTACSHFDDLVFVAVRVEL